MTSATENHEGPVQSGMTEESADSGVNTPASSPPAASEDLERSLDEALLETFPASDPIAISPATPT